MRYILLLFVVITLISAPAKAQPKLGDVAVVYICTSNLDSSLAVYQKLGFSLTASNEWPAPWAQLSDGSLIIMLRKDATPYIGLTYYTADVAAVAAQLEKDSIVFTKKPKEGDMIKRYYFKSPDGFDIMLSANPGGFTKPSGATLITMSPADFNSPGKYPNKQCGAFGEFAHPVTDLTASIAFWKKLGFKTSAIMKAPYPHAILYDGLMIIGLHQTNHFTYPAVTYFSMDAEKRIQQLKENGVQHFTDIMGKKNVSVNTREGQHFFVFSLGM